MSDFKQRKKSILSTADYSVSISLWLPVIKACSVVTAHLSLWLPVINTSQWWPPTPGCDHPLKAVITWNKNKFSIEHGQLLKIQYIKFAKCPHHIHHLSSSHMSSKNWYKISLIKTILLIYLFAHKVMKGLDKCVLKNI